jgi:dTDP-4-dehydrorhamnose 3,5-epimerase
MKFVRGPIEGVVCKPLKKFHDERGWLCELFRNDELPPEFHPVMAYLSVTEPGVARGPHEHHEQADYFCFLGPSDFKIYLWDTRSESVSKGAFQVELGGASRPLLLIVPAGVVHAYKNIGSEPGLVFNGPNRLYRGPGRTGPIDEIRHEDRADSPFPLD